MKPRRKDSSGVALNGIIRSKGSMLDLLYKTPDPAEIKKSQLAQRKNRAG